jgi:fumarate hydratase class II
MLATALVPHVGYDAATRVVHHAQAHGLTLAESAQALGLATEAEFDEWVDARRMAGDGAPQHGLG